MTDPTFLQFTNRNEYLDMRRAWSTAYANTIDRIRAIKLDTKEKLRAGFRVSPPKMRTDYWAERNQLQSLAEDRTLMKVRAQEQWQAERDAEQHQRGVAGMLAAA